MKYDLLIQVLERLCVLNSQSTCELGHSLYSIHYMEIIYSYVLL